MSSDVVFFGCWLVVIVGAGIIGWWVDKRRNERFRGWARRNGWSYSESEPSLARLSDGQPFGAGGSRTAREVLRGRFESLAALSFTYEWTTGAGKTRRTHYAHVIALALPTSLPSVEVTPEGLGARLGKLVGMQDIGFESDAFNRAYRVAAPDERTGHAIVHPRLMERLLQPDALGTPWRIDGTWILSWDSGKTKVDRLAPRLGLLAAVVRSVPRHVWLEHGHDPQTTATIA